MIQLLRLFSFIENEFAFLHVDTQMSHSKTVRASALGEKLTKVIVPTAGD
jgi:hypothetical protein